MKKATVVIPNLNGMAYLERCLTSLENQDTDDFDVLIIDNASTDGSEAFIRERFPAFTVVRMPENLGFSGGVNEGITRSETPYVILLNNDTQADPAFVSSMIRAIEKDDRIFSVSARMIKYYDRTRLDDCGDLYTILGFAVQRGVDMEVTDGRYLKPCRVFSACAGAAIYRRAVFDEIGLFDLQHFAYLEDMDVGYRALIRGYVNMYDPSAVVYHVGSGSSGAVKYSDFKVRISARNNIYLWYKNMPSAQRVINAPFLALGRKLKRGFFEKNGFSESYDAGTKEGMETRKTTKVVPFELKNLKHYFAIEWLLIKNTFIYADEYLRRRRK